MNKNPSLNDVYGFGGHRKHKHHHAPQVKGPVISGYGPVFPQQRNSPNDTTMLVHNPPPPEQRPIPPTIVTQPVSQTIAKLSPVTFFVTATGTGPLAYQWQRNHKDILGADRSIYTVPHARIGMDGNNFRCVVSNEAGFANSADAILTVTTLAPEIPLGLFSLTPGVGNRPINDAILLNPDVDGIVIATRWCNCESERGVYDFGFLIEQVQRITDAGKKAILGVGTGNMGEGDGGSKPDWVIDACADNMYTYIDNSPGGLGRTTIPVFWHPLLLQYKIELYAALGATFAGNDTITMIACNSANAQTEDWAVPDDAIIDGILPLNSTQVSRWMTAGYTHAKMVDAASQITNAVAAAFPQACIYFPMGKIHSLVMEPGGEDALSQDVCDTIRAAHGVNRLAVGRNTYSGKTGPTDFQIANPPYAGQDLFFVFDGAPEYRMNQGEAAPYDDIMQATFDRVLDAKFLEVYEKDILNISPAVIHNGHEILFSANV